MRRPFTKEEIQVVKDNYTNKTHQELSTLLPNRSRAVICQVASRLGLKKDSDVGIKHSRKCDLSPLLEETPLAYYMMGFFAADGYFTKYGGLRLSIKINDKDWLINTFKSLKCVPHEVKMKPYNQIAISANDCRNIEKIIKKFDLRNRKTHNPPQNLDFYKNLSNDLFISFLLGLIDGDGYVGKKAKDNTFFLEISGHHLWFDFFSMIKERIEKIFGYPISPLSFRRKNTLVLLAHRFPILRELKKIALGLNLPIMNRKWDKIDINHTTYYEKTEVKFEKAKELLSIGKPFNEIANTLNLARGLRKKLRARLGLPSNTRKKKNS